MLKIEAIQNGIVIDHIAAGKGMEVYRLLHLENNSQSVALLQNVKSRKYGKKDLIKIEGTAFLPRLDILGYLDHRISLIYIRNGKIAKKCRPIPPKELRNVMKCKNPRCITSTENNCMHIFRMSDSGKYRCIYCNQEILSKDY